ncbi:MAG: helix-turn-helix domain-containing protein [Chitinispirillaceae bacterium]|nr:helix-turn-helix domain-containing protein [Chitinispirillaceae bacterium]
MAQNDGTGPSVPAGEGSRGERVGEIIRRERERRQISIEAAAKTLRLNARYIEALEANDYDRLPGDTYVRVYLRSLSRFLSLDSDEIFRRFFEERGLTGADTLRKDSRTKINLAAQEEKKRDLPLVAVFSVIFLLAVFSLLVNRHGCRPSPAHKNGAAAVDTASKGQHGADKTTAEAQPPDSQKKNRREGKAPADTALSERPRTGVPSQVQSPEDTLAKAKTAEIGPAAKTVADTVTNQAQAPVVTDPGDTNQQTAATGDPQRADRDIADPVQVTMRVPVDTGKMSLKLTVAGDSCWVRVISDGAKDWRNTLSKGDSMSFTARDSFNVHAGIGEAISLTLNGTPLELPKRKGVVTFKVDRSGTLMLWTLRKWNSVFESR